LLEDREHILVMTTTIDGLWDRTFRLLLPLLLQHLQR
jgi:hypothetical protein